MAATWTDGIFKRNFVNENILISIKNLVKVMAWRRTGDKLLTEPMVA